MTRVSKNIAKELTYINRIKALEKKVAKLEGNEEQLREYIQFKALVMEGEEMKGNILKGSWALKDVIDYINNQNK